MKLSMAGVFTLGLFASVIATVAWINHSEQKDDTETWTAFVYTHGYESGRYQKTDNLENYQACKSFAQALSAEFDAAPWECGLQCGFDSRRQGYQCEKLKND